LLTFYFRYSIVYLEMYIFSMYFFYQRFVKFFCS